MITGNIIKATGFIKKGLLGFVYHTNKNNTCWYGIFEDGEFIEFDELDVPWFEIIGFNHNLSKFVFTDTTDLMKKFSEGFFNEIFVKLKCLLETETIIKSGYAGVNQKGTIVDRRIDKNAIPIQKNAMFNTPEPKDVK